MHAYFTKKLKAHVVDVDGCLEWVGCRDKDGYGRIKKEKGRYLTHRIAWELAYGPIPDGLLVLHKCDNPPCCNPEHLFLGTHGDNMRDRAAKNRHPHKGEKHPLAKLTEKDVLAIRSDPRNYQTIAADYNVSNGTIGYIINGFGWKNLPAPDRKTTDGVEGTHHYFWADTSRHSKYVGNQLSSVGIFEWIKRTGKIPGTKRSPTRVRVTGFSSNAEAIEKLAKNIVIQLDAGTYSGPKWVRVPGNWVKRQSKTGL